MKVVKMMDLLSNIKNDIAYSRQGILAADHWLEDGKMPLVLVNLKAVRDFVDRAICETEKYQNERAKG